MTSANSKDDFIKDLIKSIEDFAHYQDELEKALEKNPVEALKSLREWINEHQKKAAVVQFFVSEFMKGLEEFRFSIEQGDIIAGMLHKLEEKEDKLYSMIEKIQNELGEKMKEMMNAQKALAQYSHATGNGGKKGVVYLSKDA